MNENDKLQFLNSCGIFLKKQIQNTPEKKAKEAKQLAVIQKWHTLAQHCIKLWNGYSADYTLRPRDVLDSVCPLCESRLKTVPLKVFDEHVCLADDALIKIKRIPKNFDGTSDSFLQRTSCVSSKMKLSQQAQKIEPVLRLQKNARTLGKLLAVEGPGSMVQLCSSVPTIRTKRINTESLTEQVEMLEKLVSNGYLKVLAKLAREKEEERKQAERRELFARKSLTINIDRNDIERLQGSPADAIISTPMQTAQLMNLLPLSAGRAPNYFFQPNSPESNYRKTLWPNRKCLDSPQADKNLAETPNSTSDATAPAQQIIVPIQRIDLSNFEPDLIQATNCEVESVASNNFTATSSESNCCNSNGIESFLDDITKDHMQRADKRLLEKQESSEETSTSPAKKTRKTERTVRRHGRPVNGVRRSKEEARKVQFSINATPESSNNDVRSSLISKYKPCYRTLNGQNVISKSKSSKYTSLPNSVRSSFASASNSIKGGSKFLAKKLIAESSAGLRSGTDLPSTLAACIRSEKSTRQRRHSQPSHDDFGAPRPEFRAFIHLKSPLRCFNPDDNNHVHPTTEESVATMTRTQDTPSAMQQSTIKSSLFISKTAPYNIFSCGAQLKRMLGDDLMGTPGHEIEISDDEIPDNGTLPDKEVSSNVSSCASADVNFKQSVGNNARSHLDQVRGLLGNRENPFTIDSEDDSGRSTPKLFDDESVSRENITPPNEGRTSPAKSGKSVRTSRLTSAVAEKSVHRYVNRSNSIHILNFSNSENRMIENNGISDKIIRPANSTFDQSYFSLSEDNYSATESDEQLSGSNSATRRSLGRRRSKSKKDFDASVTSGVASDGNSSNGTTTRYQDNNTEASHDVKVNGHSHGFRRKVRSSLMRERSYSPKTTSPRCLTSLDKDNCLNSSPVLTKGDPFLGGNACVATQELSPQFVVSKNLDSNWNVPGSSQPDATFLRKPCHRADPSEMKCSSLSQEVNETDSEVFAHLTKNDYIASSTTLFESI